MNTNIHAVIFVSHNPKLNRKHGEELAAKTTLHMEDIYRVEKDGNSIKDRVIEDLIERLNYKPLIGDINIAIIDDADTLTHRAQNRLLKTLEEPRGKVLIIFLSENEENLLATIRSRCVIYNLHHKGQWEEGSEVSKKVVKGIIEKKSYYYFIDLIKEISKDRHSAIKYLNEVKWELKEQLIEKENYEKAYRLVKIIEEAEKDIKANITQSYAIKNVIIKILEENL